MDPNKNKLLEACKFSMNEIVLCYEPDPMKAKMLYDAKILDAEVTKDEKGKKVFEYYIHFQGWNKSWDRWILENKILKANETNRAIQTKLHDEAIRLKKRKPKACTKYESCDEKDDKSVTSLGSDGNSDDVKASQIPLVTLDIPKVLAVRLEDDCYNIKRKKKLLHLPRKPSVNEIFNAYYTHCEKVIKTPEGRNLSLKILYEMIHGLNTYFNYFLFSTLLYNFEREQYHSYFPEELKLSAEGLSPMPPITPKLISPNSIGLSDSSRSNSRTSSFCEDSFSTSSAPLLKEVFKPKLNRKRKGEGKAKSVDGVCTTTKRKKNYTIVNVFPLDLDPKVSNRETRSAKKTIVYDRDKDCVFPKEEKAIKPMEILAENIIDMDRTVTRSKKYASKPYGNKESKKIASKETIPIKESINQESNKTSSKLTFETTSKSTSAAEMKASSNLDSQKDQEMCSKHEECLVEVPPLVVGDFMEQKVDLIDKTDVECLEKERLLITVKNKEGNSMNNLDTNEPLLDTKNVNMMGSKLNESKDDITKKVNTDESLVNSENKDMGSNLNEREHCSTSKVDTNESLRYYESEEMSSQFNTLDNNSEKTNLDASETLKHDLTISQTDPISKSDIPIKLKNNDNNIEKVDIEIVCNESEEKIVKVAESSSKIDHNSDESTNHEVNLNSISINKNEYCSIKINTDNTNKNDLSCNTNIVFEDNQSITPNSSKDCKENDVNCPEENSSRRSMRPPKFPAEIDEQESLPIGSTAKSLFESYKTPLKLSTETHCEILHDKTFMVYPQTPDGNTPADIYGLEHLLRLFVKLPLLLAASHIEERKINVILKNVSHLLEYISKQTDLFVDPSDIYSESII